MFHVTELWEFFALSAVIVARGPGARVPVLFIVIMKSTYMAVLIFDKNGSLTNYKYKNNIL